MADSTELFRMMSKLQFHYWFGDKTHTMDALVLNKCERELLELTKAVAKVCGVAIKMETEPTGKGGIKSWITVTAKSPKKTPAAKIALVNTLVTASLATPQTSLAEAATTLLDKMLINKGQEQELAQLKMAALQLAATAEQSGVVKKRRSNFYSVLHRYQKVKSVSVALTDEGKKLATEEQLVAREHFKSLVVKSDAATQQTVEGAQIEIISPVLVKGNHKWKGMYNGSPISFVMKSDEFMAMVQSGKVEFKSGSTITCKLQIEKKSSSTGVERIIGYSILGVDSYSENGKTIETPEAKQKQKQQTVSKRQLDLFG